MNKNDIENIEEALFMIEEGKNYYSPEYLKQLLDFSQVQRALTKKEKELFIFLCKEKAKAKSNDPTSVSQSPRTLRRLKSAILNKIGRSHFEQYC